MAPKTIEEKIIELRNAPAKERDTKAWQAKYIKLLEKQDQR